MPSFALDQLPHFVVQGVDHGAAVALRLEGQAEPVRLVGVEWPRGDNESRRALAFADNLLRGEEVALALSEAGGKGASAAYVLRLPDGLLVNLELLRAGYAVVPDGSFEHARLFRYYARRAREAGKGVWSAPPVVQQKPEEPSAAPPVSDPSAVAVYVTKSGKKYHLRDCVYLSKSCQEITLEEARKRYTPCSRCKPPP